MDRDELTRLARRWLPKLIGYGALALMVLLGWLFMNRDAFRYFDWRPEAYIRFWPQRHLLAIHVASASVAIILGPLQFITPLRRRLPALHRSVGWIYLVCAALTGYTTYQLAFYSCPACRPPFVIWTAVFSICTAAAIWLAIRRDFTAHRAFMIRSYVLFNGFVFVRLDNHLIGTPLEVPLPMGPGIERAPMLLWVAWLVPLLLLEIYLSWWPTVRGRKRAKKAPKRVTTEEAESAAT